MSRPEATDEPLIPRRLVVMATLLLVLVVVWWFLADSAERRYARGLAALDDDPAAAEVHFERSVELAGGRFPKGRLGWVRALGRQGKWLEAAGCFSEIDDPSDCEDEELLALAEEAAAPIPMLSALALKAMDEDGRGAVAALRTWIHIERGAGRNADALAHAEELVRRDADDPFGWETIGDLGDRNFASIAAAYRRALRSTDGVEDRERLHLKIIEPLLRMGESGEARTAFDALPSPTRSRYEVRFLEVRLARLEGRTEEANELAEELVSERETTAALFQRGLVRFDLSNWDGAVADFEKVVERDPYQKEAHYKLGMALTRLGRDDDAKEHLDRSRELTRLSIELLDLLDRVSDETDAATFERIAEVCEGLGRTNEARAWRDRADGDPGVGPQRKR